MPIILAPAAYAEWLAVEDQPSDRLSRLLGPYPADQMTAYAVSPLVNNPRYDVPEYVAPVG